MEIDAAQDEIPFLRGGHAASGTAFVSRAVSGHTWGGSADELDDLVNPDDISHLVVFDTWVRNCDRYPPDLKLRKANYDNVFLADVSEAQRLQLVAMDHTHCFTCGRDLNAHIARIESVKDDRLYGLFPGFVPAIRQHEVEACVSRLRELLAPFVADIVATIPADWQVSAGARSSLVELITRRAEFVGDTVSKLIAKVCWRGKLFDTDR
ncbi:MAG TPA: hypothetical protein VGL71_12700 [Urbifossiella sp.]|jgi:hypothetical protein